MTSTSPGSDDPADDVDELVLARARDGDHVAFAMIYRNLQPRLRRYAASLIGDDADDVTAEAWLQIARDVRGFRGDVDGFRGWTVRIVRNRAMDLARARSRRPTDVLPVEELLDTASPHDTEADALAVIGTQEAVELIASLPPDQAEAVMLRAVVGLDSARAGEILGKSPTAVRVSAHRGLKRLARRLDAERRV